MPWINPFLNEWDPWNRVRKNVGWPIANDVRRFPEYWFALMSQNVSPIMPRIITRFRYVINPSFQYLWTDLALTPDGTDLVGDSGLNGAGQRITVRVREYNNDSDPPAARGIRWRFEYSRVGFADNIVSTLFANLRTLGAPYVPHDQSWIFETGNTTYRQWTTNKVPFMDTDWNSAALGLDMLFAATSTRRQLPNNP